MVLEIQPQHLAFGEMIHGRLFRIPDYQRTYSWQSRQRGDLFEDIQRTWESGPDRRHFMATIVGLRRETRTIIIDEHQVIDVVDGQQRLTTLILLMKSIAKSIDRSSPIGDRLGREIDEALVKPDEASLLLLQTNHDSSHYFTDYLRTGSNPDPAIAATLADREILQAIRDCEKFVDTWQQNNPLTDLIALIRNRLTFIFHEIGDEAVVYTVFEVLNSRGLEVSYFDRLKSMLMGAVFESETGNRDELISEVHGLWSQIYGYIGLNRTIDSETLRFAATLRSMSPASRPSGEEAAVDVLYAQSKDSPKQVIETTRWLLSVTQAVVKLASDHRRSAVTRIAQGRLLATAILLRMDLSAEDKEELLRAWEAVTFHLYGLRGHDARWSVGDYTRLSWKTIQPQTKKSEVFGGIRELAKSYPIEDTISDIKGQIWYPHWAEEVRYFLYRYEEHLAKQVGQKFDNEQWNRIGKRMQPVP